jgi:signal peptide peptidase SppA
MTQPKNNYKDMNNLIVQYNLNKGKVMMAMPEYYQAFKQRIEQSKLLHNQIQPFQFGNPLEHVVSIKVKQDGCDASGFCCEDRPYSLVGDIAVICFHGFVVSNCSEDEEEEYGCISLQRFCQKLQAAADDEMVKVIVVDFDSGGGYTGYSEETCQLIKELSIKKPIYAYSSNMVCSMAYAVACNCNYLVVSPSTLVGSVGTYCEYLTYNGSSELSKDGVTVSNLENLGVTVTTFQGGTQKTIGSETIALSKEQRDLIMSEITDMNNEFKSMVNTNRNGVKDEFMQGQPFYGKEALKLGTNLVDGTVNSLAQFLQFISSNK